MISGPCVAVPSSLPCVSHRTLLGRGWRCTIEIGARHLLSRKLGRRVWALMSPCACTMPEFGLRFVIQARLSARGCDVIARRHRLKREKRSAFRLALGAALFFALIVPVNPAASADALAEADALIRDVEALWTGGDRMVIDAKLRRALEIREAQCGPDSPLVADVLGRLGRNAWNRRDLTTAEQMFRRALAIDEQAQPDSFDTARLLGDLGAT